MLLYYLIICTFEKFYAQQLRDAPEFLNMKFQIKLDLNFYFFHHVIRYQEQLKLPTKQQSCVGDGIYCPLINNKNLIYSLSNKTEPYQQNLIPKILPFVRDIEQRRLNGDQQIYYYTDKSNYIIDEQLFYLPTMKQNSTKFLIEFEFLKPSNTETFVDTTFQLDILLPKIIAPKTQPQNQHLVYAPMKIDMKIDNFYLPGKESIVRSVPSELKREQKEQKDLIGNIEYQSFYPSQNYLFTKQDKIRRISFEKPLYLVSLYIRKHSTLAYSSKLVYSENNEINYSIRSQLEQILILGYYHNLERFIQQLEYIRLRLMGIGRGLQMKYSFHLKQTLIILSLNILVEFYEQLISKIKLIIHQQKVTFENGKLKTNIQMNIEINLTDLQNLLANIETSFEQAINFFLENGNNSQLQELLCAEWYNQFYLSRHIHNGEKQLQVYLYLVSDILKVAFLRSETQAQQYAHSFRNYIIKALSNIHEGVFSKEFKRSIFELLKVWEEKKFYEKSLIMQMQEILDPNRFSKPHLEQSYPPPNYLVSYAKNKSELLIRANKLNSSYSKLKEFEQAINRGEETKSNDIDIYLDTLQRTADSQQKYRQLVLKDSLDLLREIDKKNQKKIFDLKFLVNKIEKLKEWKRIRETQDVIMQ